MKKIISLLLISSVLAGCTSTSIPSLWTSNSKRPEAKIVDTNKNIYQLSPTHWSDVSKIRDEASRLSVSVAKKEITKVQAAQYLNQYRISLVGHNIVDDSMYDIYLRSAVESQSGKIDTDQSKIYIKSALEGWQQRWPNMQAKPNNPAFTNFLMEIMKIQPLQ